jgi:hypothetical protein
MENPPPKVPEADLARWIENRVELCDAWLPGRFGFRRFRHISVASHAAAGADRISILIQDSLNWHLALPEVTAGEGMPDSRIGRCNPACAVRRGC